jgi:ATP-dependent DNA helicase DinG
MQRAANWVIPQTQLPIRVQGDWPKHKLLAWFSATPGAVLFATASFWEGIDLPGQQLRCVIIDKIPFTSPEEPLHQARVEELKQQGGDWFKGYALPMALLRLKQGVGRLIRTQSDEGLLALLDPRLQTKGYGKTLLAQLPPMRPLTSLAKPLPLT